MNSDILKTYINNMKLMLPLERKIRTKKEIRELDETGFLAFCFLLIHSRNIITTIVYSQMSRENKCIFFIQRFLRIAKMRGRIQLIMNTK